MSEVLLAACPLLEVCWPLLQRLLVALDQIFSEESILLVLVLDIGIDLSYGPLNHPHCLPLGQCGPGKLRILVPVDSTIDRRLLAERVLLQVL